MELRFDAAGRAVALVSADGSETTVFGYDGSGRLSSITTPDQAVTTLTYGYDGLLWSVSSGGRSAGVAHNPSGHLTEVTRPALMNAVFAYDSNGRLLQATRNVLKEKWTYQNGLAVSHSVGDRDETRFTPAAALGLAALAGGPLAVRSRDAFGRLSMAQLDSQGRVLMSRADDGTVTTWTRDAAGRVETITDPLGRTTTYVRDALGYVTRETLPGGAFRLWEYNGPFHALTKYTDERGFATVYTHDPQGHVLTITNAAGHVTTQTWLNGLLKTRALPLKPPTVFAYDAYRRLERQTDPLGNYVQLTYDANGNIDTRRDKRGFITTYQYDDAGRLIRPEKGARPR